MKAAATLPEDIPMTNAMQDFVPVLLQEIELSQPLPMLTAFHEPNQQTYQRTRCLIRLHTRPLGYVEFTFTEDTLSPVAYAPRIWQTLGERINAHLREDGLPERADLDATGLVSAQTPPCIVEREVFLQTAPFASVVVCTRDRPDLVARCIPALLAQWYPAYEIIIIDNASVTSATADLLQEQYADEPRIRYVREDRPGLSAARNRGIVEARGKIIAFTDDDVVVDRYWLAGLAKGFTAAEHVACVTGMVLSLELETPAQCLFEADGGFPSSFCQRICDMRQYRWKDSSYPYIAGACSVGAGASMAFTTDFLQKEGGFDPALGGGTLACSGEDTGMFVNTILHGYRLVYEPTSLAFHQHRREYTALQKQLYGYGVGFTAYLTKVVIDHPWQFLRIMYALFITVRATRSAEAGEKVTSYSLEWQNLKRKAQHSGPMAYIRGRLTCGWRRTGLALAHERAQAAHANGVRVPELVKECLGR